MEQYIGVNNSTDVCSSVQRTERGSEPTTDK